MEKEENLGCSQYIVNEMAQSEISYRALEVLSTHWLLISDFLFKTKVFC
jgi:hypothetical protein